MNGFWKSLGLAIVEVLGGVGGRTICVNCVRDGDDYEPGHFGDYSLCGRCHRPVTSKDQAFFLKPRGPECPLCRASHLDVCSSEAVDAILGGPPQFRYTCAYCGNKTSSKPAYQAKTRLVWKSCCYPCSQTVNWDPIPEDKCDPELVRVAKENSTP